MHITKSIKIPNDLFDLVKSFLIESGYKVDQHQQDYVEWRLVGGLGIAIQYSSGKLVLQGRKGVEEIYSEIDRMILRSMTGVSVVGEVSKKKTFEKKKKAEEDEANNKEFELFVPHIGVDETGKGDYFGPLVVTACFADNAAYDKLSDLNVGDSKKIKDDRILVLSRVIENICICETSVVTPVGYEEKMEEYGNVAILLAKEHSKVIERTIVSLNTRKLTAEYVLIDQFSTNENRVLDELGPYGKGIEFRQMHKGERDIVVAAASIVARARFLYEMEQMSRKFKFDFPKGATHVINPAKEFVKKHGKKELKNVAKVSFKTTKKVLGK